MVASRGQNIERLSGEILELLGTGRQTAPISDRDPGFSLDSAYEMVGRIRALREARGERPVGRKIGFTNPSVWTGYDISGPIWNYVFDSTVWSVEGTATFDPKGFAELRIEPEIVLHLSVAPEPGMDETALVGCIDWIAPGFELVHSVFPGWRFSAADAAAAFGVHGALFVGRPLVLDGEPGAVAAALADVEVELSSEAGEARYGKGANVLGSPLTALRFLVREITAFPAGVPLAAGEIVTTGTLTDAMPVRGGDVWSARFKGLDLAPLRLRVA